MINVFFARGLAGAGICVAAAFWFQGAQASDLPEGCRVLDASDVIRVMVCTNPMEQAALVEAGKAACGEHLPCGVWIWSDERDAPQTAPENHDGLTQEQITTAQGVWVAEQEMFVGIEALRK